MAAMPRDIRDLLLPRETTNGSANGRSAPYAPQLPAAENLPAAMSGKPRSMSLDEYALAWSWTMPVDGDRLEEVYVGKRRIGSIYLTAYGWVGLGMLVFSTDERADYRPTKEAAVERLVIAWLDRLVRPDRDGRPPTKRPPRMADDLGYDIDDLNY